ncbi:MAG: hypothetical protein DRN20_06350 [Thermoplasmata archaeon]|nr:MAG: hypothetical protein DRN20_06350 [Thermoplasmata archaeon]
MGNKVRIMCVSREKYPNEWVAQIVQYPHAIGHGKTREEAIRWAVRIAKEMILADKSWGEQPEYIKEKVQCNWATIDLDSGDSQIEGAEE